MGFEKVYITKQGALLAAKTLQGKKIQFDHAEIGSGNLSGNAADKTALTTKVLECPIEETKITGDTQASVSFIFKNTDAKSAFYFREIGLFAIDPDTKAKVLYAYANAGSNAEYINNSIAEKIEKHIQINVIVDNASNVTITLDSTQIYVTEKELQEAITEAREFVGKNYGIRRKIVDNVLSKWERICDNTGLVANATKNGDEVQNDFDNLLCKYPSILKCIPILIAKREMDIEAIDEEGSFCYNFKKMNYSVEQYKIFMRKTGIFNLIENRIIGSLVDYVTGIETGLDSNGRKNRGGHLMENLVESYIQKAGFVKGITYFKEMYIHAIEKKWGIDLSSISNQGKAEKRFDFVVKTPTMVYGIETNFYGSSGSKLNETARSYKTITLETKDLTDFTFVWFTDGKGWNSARRNLEETFDVLEHIYNINDMENGIISKIMK